MCRTVFVSQRAVVESDFLFVPLPLIQDLWKVVVVPSTSPLLVVWMIVCKKICGWMKIKGVDGL